MNAKYFIQDWAGNDKTAYYGEFDSFEEAWERLYQEFRDIEDEREYELQLQEFDVLKRGEE